MSIFRRSSHTQSNFDQPLSCSFFYVHCTPMAHIVYRTAAMFHARVSGRGFWDGIRAPEYIKGFRFS
jgi:hypothetical protein